MQFTAMLVVLWLLASHWLADFVFQTDSMAKNKSWSNAALGKHIAAYISVLGVLTVAPFFAFTNVQGASVASVMDTFGIFLILNAALHFVTDFVTSRAVKLELANEDHHNAFVIIGVDQLIHHLCVLVTFFWLTGNLVV